MSLVQAVMFTHCASLKYENEASFQAKEGGYIRNYKESFKDFLICNEKESIVSDLFLYIDAGVKELVKLQLENADKFKLDAEINERAQIFKELLKTSEDQARAELNLNKSQPPTFHYVGVQELTILLNNLWKVDPSLLKPGMFLGINNQFTYDSPKFVEAVIRLARGDIPHLAESPVVRIDDDAKINSKSIKLLLAEFKSLSLSKPFYFFSGRYGREDSKLDIVNDFAVRTHWFFPKGTVAGDDQFVTPGHEFHAHMKAAEIFLNDLAILGARQPALPELAISENLQKALDENRVKNIRTTTSPQVISGAGLIMARRNIVLLPPFICCKSLITWIDDYLKRELHEMLGDISESATQCIEDAKFEQDRHPSPDGITQSWIANIESPDSYLKRLLHGCMFSAIIGDKSENNYAGIIKEIVAYKLNQNQFNADPRKKALETYLLGVAFDHYRLVLDCWTSKEFEGYASYLWANAQLTTLSTLKINEINEQNAPELVKDIVDDAMNYLNLVFNWHRFTRAIERLEFLGNRWLYQS